MESYTVSAEQDRVTIRSRSLDMKIDSNRRIYVLNKSRGDKHFRFINHKAPIGMDRDTKVKYLTDLYHRLIDRIEMQQRGPDDEQEDSDDTHTDENNDMEVKQQDD